MSVDITTASSEHVGYVYCNFCNTILAVSVPYTSSTMLTIVTVRCGHCSNLLSVNLGALLIQPAVHYHHHHHHQIQDFQLQKLQHNNTSAMSEADVNKDNNVASSSKGNIFGPFRPQHYEEPKMAPIRPPEKRQRVPSAYNRFIKEEIQRIKASNPEISHREAFSTAAKNWAHFPHIHFGRKLEGNSNKQANKMNVDNNGGDQETHHKALGLY